MAKHIKQQVTFDANPRTVYNYFMDSRKHAQFTGSRCSVSRKKGGKFRCFDGQIEGYTIETKANEKIVQAWRSKDWPQGEYSLVTYQFKKASNGRTKMTMTQFGVPDNKVNRVRSGWKKHYWEPLKDEFEAA